MTFFDYLSNMTFFQFCAVCIVLIALAVWSVALVRAWRKP